MVKRKKLKPKISKNNLQILEKKRAAQAWKKQQQRIGDSELWKNFILSGSNINFSQWQNILYPANNNPSFEYEGSISLTKPSSTSEYFIYFLLLTTLLHTASASQVDTKSYENQQKKSDTSTDHPMTSASKTDAIHYNDKYSFFHETQNSDIFNINSLSEKNSETTFFNKSKKFQQNKKQAEKLIAWVEKNVPEKLNRPIGSAIRVSENHVRLIPHKNAFKKENEARMTRLHEFDKIYEQNLKVMEIEFLNEISAPALNDPIHTTEEEAEAINEEYIAIQNYMLDIYTRMIIHQLLPYFQGGTCGTQSETVVIEALKQGLDIELIELTDKNNPKQTHTFTMIGRDRETTLTNPRLWNDEVMLIDFWVNDSTLISGVDLKKNPDRYGFYFYKNWKWETIIHSPIIPESLKGPCYKKYEKLRRYFEYCQNKLTIMLKNGIELAYPPFPQTKVINQE